MADQTHPPVLIHTTPTCPDRRALKAWLASQDMNFEERDLSEPAVTEDHPVRRIRTRVVALEKAASPTT